MKTAVKVCEPAGNDVVVSVATPLATDAEPSDVEPYLNCTWPVAVDGDIVAVSATLAPAAAVAAGEAASVVVVATGAAAVIATVETADVDVVKPAVSAGVNTAVSEWLPTDKVVVFIVAVPPLTATGLPRFVVPSLN